MLSSAVISLLVLGGLRGADNCFPGQGSMGVIEKGGEEVKHHILGTVLCCLAS